MCRRLLRELLGEGALKAEQSTRVNEWLCSVEEERSALTTASGPDSGIENSSTEDSDALRRGRPSVRNQVSPSQIGVRTSQETLLARGFKVFVCFKRVTQNQEAADNSWSHEHEGHKDGETEKTVVQLQAQVQRLERENTDFLAALEDAMEQYKQQVRFQRLLGAHEAKGSWLIISRRHPVSASNLKKKNEQLNDFEKRACFKNKIRKTLACKCHFLKNTTLPSVSE